MALSDENMNILKEYTAQEFPKVPDMAPTKEDLNSEVILKPIPMRAVPYPKTESWENFWNTGIVTLVNTLMTSLGRGLVAQRDPDGRVTNVYPVRTNMRGLSEEDTITGLELFSRYLAKNAETLHEESYEAEKKLNEAIELARKEREEEEAQKRENAPEVPQVPEEILQHPGIDPSIPMQPPAQAPTMPQVQLNPSTAKAMEKNKKTSRFLKDRLEALREENAQNKEKENPPSGRDGDVLQDVNVNVENHGDIIEMVPEGTVDDLNDLPDE